MMLGRSLKKVFVLLVATVGLLHAATYSVDTAHSRVGFKVKHMLINNVTGYFQDFKGSFEIRDKKIIAVDGEIKSKSVDTDNKKRDAHLRNDDFFDTAKHPMIRFVMKENRGDTIIGDLTIRGITRSVTLSALYGGEVDDPWGNRRAGIELSGIIDRNDFEVSFKSNSMMIANKVKLLIELEGIQKK